MVFGPKVKTIITWHRFLSVTYKLHVCNLIRVNKTMRWKKRDNPILFPI